MPKVIDENKIFKTIINMLVSHGYEKSTTKEIAELAKVNEATLFRKYGSKSKLFEIAIRNQLSNTPLNKVVYTGDLVNDLNTIVEAYLETNRIYGEIILTILAELPRQPELKDSVSFLWENFQSAVKIIQTYQVNGELTGDSPIISLNNLIGPIMTSQMFRRTGLNLPIVEINPAEHVKEFLQGRKT